MKAFRSSSQVQEGSEADPKNASVSKIIESYEQLLKSLNQKIGELTIDLELTRQKLQISETRYSTLLAFVQDKKSIDVSKMLDKIDELEKKLVNKNAELNRYKAKLLSENVGANLQKQPLYYIGKANLSNYFTFESIREDEAIMSRSRKNSTQENENSVPWQKALEVFADSASSPTKFKQKTAGFLKKFIPHEQRSKVWPFIFENQLGISSSLYVELMERMQKNPIESHVKSQIQRDIVRSFNCKIEFANREALSSEVQEVLEIFHLLRPDISYVQGMTYPVIMLTVVVGKVDAFRIFSNLVLANKFFRNMYSFQEKSIEVYCKVFDSLLKESFPEVSRHLENLNIKPELFIIEWFFTIFSRGLSLETTLKIWDLIGYERETVLYRLCMAIFELIGKRLTSHNYEQTVGLIRSYWSYVDEARLLELTVGGKLEKDKLSKLFAKAGKQATGAGK